MAVCVLREHCRSAHSAASDDPTGGSRAVARNRNGQAAAPSRCVTRRARRLPLSLTEWESDFHIRDWGRTVHEFCGLEGVFLRSFLVNRQRDLHGQELLALLKLPVNLAFLTSPTHTAKYPSRFTNTFHRSRGLSAPSAEDPGQASWSPVLVQRVASEGWGGCGQVPFLLAERAQ